MITKQNPGQQKRVLINPFKVSQNEEEQTEYEEDCLMLSSLDSLESKHELVIESISYISDRLAYDQLGSAKDDVWSRLIELQEYRKMLAEYIEYRKYIEL
jgi:hypothetical protein